VTLNEVGERLFDIDRLLNLSTLGILYVHLYVIIVVIIIIVIITVLIQLDLYSALYL